MDSKISRRSFVQGASVGAVGLAGAYAATTAHAGEAATPAWDAEADVVVIGSGGAGHGAALEAAATGASVIMLEKLGILGGSSAMCDGILGGAETRMEQEQGITVTVDDTYEAFMSRRDVYGPRDPEVTRVAAEECGKAIDWLEEMGVPFEPKVAPRFNYTDLPVIHQVEGKGAAMMQVMVAEAEKAGIQTWTEAPARQIIMEDGRAVGVLATKDSTDVRIKANKGVVIAAGGFTASPELLVALNPENVNMMGTACTGATGDGILMASEVGAHLARTDYQPMMHSLAGWGTSKMFPVDYYGRYHGIFLDAKGDRFVNESMDFLTRQVPREVLKKELEQGKKVVYLIPTSEASADLVSAEDFDWSSGATASEAVAPFGLDTQRVEETVRAYNASYFNGRDERFGRSIYDMVPMMGPFYASEVMVTTPVTTGGIKTDAQGRVLRLKSIVEEGDMLRPIPGLYAAGETCEWNTAIGWTAICCIALGRVAGRTAAAGE